ncbi:G-protein coupled receptor 161-like [Amphiura filiformis]|uniref:G-protein coupled receptor 161-like n=1 Tax=Amphiura filiformis TaxID=82378 RepID=UPI003B21E64A
MLVIISLSITGNALVLSTLCKKKSLQNKTAIFVANLAIADLLNAVLCMPFIFISSIVGYWSFTDALCSFSGVMGILMGTTSLATLAAIAYERYSAIVHPLQYHDTMTPSRIATLISFAWIQGWALAMCPIFGWSYYTYLVHEYICTVDWAFDASFTYTIITFAFGIPFCVMVYCYGRIFRVARRHSRRVAAIDFCTNSKSGLAKSMSFHPGTDQVCQWKNKKSINISLSAQKLKKEAKAATMLMIVMGTFMACWIPHGCTMICMAVGDKCILTIPESVYTATTWLAMCASFCNPLVYGLMNRQYREAFRSICCSVCLCHKACKSPHRKSSSESDDVSTETKGSAEDTPQPAQPPPPHFGFEDVDKSPQCQVFVILRADKDDYKAFEI